MNKLTDKILNDLKQQADLNRFTQTIQALILWFAVFLIALFFLGIPNDAKASVMTFNVQNGAIFGQVTPSASDKGVNTVSTCDSDGNCQSNDYGTRDDNKDNNPEDKY